MSKHNRKQNRKIEKKLAEMEASDRAKARRYAKKAGGIVALPPKRKMQYGNAHSLTIGDLCFQ